MARARRVLIVGYFGFGNLGDDAILDATLQALASGADEPPEITVVVGCCAEAASRFGCRTVHWQDSEGIAREVRESDLVVVGGGGLFQDWWGVDADGLVIPSHWGMGLYAGPAILAAAFGTPVALHALGVGPLASEASRRLAKAACDAASLITVRDRGSRDLLARCGVEPGKVRITADPVWALEPPDQAETARGKAAPANTGRPLVAVALRPWGQGPDPARWEAEVARGLDLIVDRHGASLVMVPFQSVHHERPVADPAATDLGVADRVVRLMRHGNQAQVLETPTTPGAAVALFSRCDAAVAMRLHAVILAALAGTPSTALVYDPKVRPAADDLGLGDHAIDLGEVSDQLLAEAVGRLLGGSKGLRETVVERRRRLAADARSGLAALAALVADRPPAVTLASEELGEHLGRLVGAQLGQIAPLRRAVAEYERLAAELEATRHLVVLRQRELTAALAENTLLQEQYAAGLGVRQRDRDDIERLTRLVAVLEARVAGLQTDAGELERWQTSRLWRLGSFYWALRARLAGRGAGGAGGADRS